LGVLDGQGKRVNPNAFIEEGFFDQGLLKDTQNEYNPQKENWNDYLDSLNNHIKIVETGATKDNLFEPTCNQLVTITKLIHDNKEHLSEIVNKEVILIFGNKGCGKSTLANSFINGARNVRVDNGRYEPVYKVMYKDQYMFEIKHTNEKSDHLVEYAPIDSSDNTFLVEYPYPNHQRFPNKFSDLQSMQYILNKCKTF